MHVLGFWHEHARADWDRYIHVNWNEILPGFEINFIKSRSSNLLMPYDYSSVMHYGRLAFSWRGLPTITPLWAPSIHIGQQWNLSASVITRVLKLYGCSPSSPGPRGRGSHAHSTGRSPAPASLPLQRLLEALSAESRRPDPNGSSKGDQPVPAGPGDNPRGWEYPAEEAQCGGLLKAASDPGFLPKVKAQSRSPWYCSGAVLAAWTVHRTHSSIFRRRRPARP
ncbi:hypothetical protein P7K49_029770, partial [Saguinus oedipus]